VSKIIWVSVKKIAFLTLISTFIWIVICVNFEISYLFRCIIGGVVSFLVCLYDYRTRKNKEVRDD